MFAHAGFCPSTRTCSFTCAPQSSLAVVFFFQAEDGIRDLVRSRGLGDVYKRQPHADAGHPGQRLQGQAMDLHREDAHRRGPRMRKAQVPVSYTHLTLPTSDLV